MDYVLLVGYVAAIVWETLPIVYRVTAPDWHLTRTGRALMWLLGSTASLFALLLTGRIFGDYEAKPFVHAAVYGAVLYAGVRLAVLFVELRIELEKLIRLERLPKKDVKS
jgi:hypothetical protein